MTNSFFLSVSCNEINQVLGYFTTRGRKSQRVIRMNKCVYDDGVFSPCLSGERGSVFWQCVCTYELLVAAIQCHVSECSGDGADHPVVVHPQQLHQDGQTFFFTHSCSDVGRKLQTHKNTLQRLYKRFWVITRFLKCGISSSWWTETSNLPVSGGEVLQGAGGALQCCRVGALSQQVEVRLHHHGVPEQLRPPQRLEETWDWPDAIPLPKTQREHKMCVTTNKARTSFLHIYFWKQLIIGTDNFFFCNFLLSLLSYLAFRPAASLPAVPPFSPAQVVQLLHWWGET